MQMLFLHLVFFIAILGINLSFSKLFKYCLTCFLVHRNILEVQFMTPPLHQANYLNLLCLTLLTCKLEIIVCVLKCYCNNYSKSLTYEQATFWEDCSFEVKFVCKLTMSFIQYTCKSATQMFVSQDLLFSRNTKI